MKTWKFLVPLTLCLVLVLSVTVSATVVNSKTDEPLLDGDTGMAELISGDMNTDEKVTTDDAVYLLLSVMFGPSEYPIFGSVNQDLDGNGRVDTNDAVYLLLYVMFGAEDYPLAE